MLIVAHDARIIPYVDQVFNLDDGSLRNTDDRGQPEEAADRNGEHAPRYPTVH